MKKQSILGLSLASTLLLTGAGYTTPGLFPLEMETAPEKIEEVTEIKVYPTGDRFTPREQEEAEEVRRIIKFFKKQMAPKRTEQKIFLKSPNVFRLKYMFKNGQEHGKWRGWYKNGQLAYEREYRISGFLGLGKNHGSTRVWDKSGKLLAMVIYKNGHIINTE